MRVSSAVRSRLLMALCSTVVLASCTASHRDVSQLAPARDAHSGLRFDNQGRDRVDVYLVGETRSWRIGRLEPGQARWLNVPTDIPETDLTRMQIAVVANATMVIDPRRDPRAITSLKQPVMALMGQRWGYVFGQLTSARPGVQLP